ncbi:uncharacterized protein LAESUDRAFT_722917 [Laetiporus sulphureus 93-53]|uniref:Uncharacterized protein n=1 Tax=Laetiporus sulphureus 93-53 TaxID=1314785 RepID=A0A165FMG6_9APHY|nr:uncharacterized protein LAESUDRAFT_722917 [Laetiporus sulphureus 93-53]KZT09193.1 hypothetical protein LAESUDRAFT_722917 [Laetiporus sulphureus 93-53]
MMNTCCSYGKLSQTSSMSSRDPAETLGPRSVAVHGLPQGKSLIHHEMKTSLTVWVHALSKMRLRHPSSEKNRRQ